MRLNFEWLAVCWKSKAEVNKQNKYIDKLTIPQWRFSGPIKLTGITWLQIQPAKRS